MNRGTAGGRLVRRLLRQRGVGRHELFLVQGEGRRLPGPRGGRPIEAISGFALGEDGRIHGFWLDWDAAAGRHTLDPFYLVADQSGLADDPELATARARLADRRRRRGG